jgi:thiol-disulfide isomerase/thioredoxin
LELPVRLIVLLLIGLVASACDRQKDEAPQAPVEEADSGKGIDRSRKGEPAPAVEFHDPEGDDTNLADFRGKPLLVNLWASWCAPCVKELPTLDRLATANAAKLAVVAVSQDMAPQSSVSAFLAAHEIGDLGAYHDPEMALTSALGVQIMPTSVLYDAAGKEVWRFTGDLDWTGVEAANLLAEAR